MRRCQFVASIVGSSAHAQDWQQMQLFTSLTVAQARRLAKILFPAKTYGWG